jgi:hypothetical protein
MRTEEADHFSRKRRRAGLYLKSEQTRADARPRDMLSHLGFLVEACQHVRRHPRQRHARHARHRA